MQDSQLEGNTFGNFDKKAFLSILKDNLLLIPNMPTKGGKYVGQQRPLQLAKQKTRHLEEDDQNHSYEQFKVPDYRKKKRNYLNLFTVDRGECNNCQRNDKKCIAYRASFNLESFRGIEIFQCLNCGCPMNSHYIIPAARSFSNLICNQVNRRYIQPGHYDFKALSAIFFVDREKSKNFEIDVETFVSGLNEGSFNIFSFYEMEIVDLQRIWMEKALYSLKLDIPKDQYEDYTSFLDRFLELFDIYGHEGIYNMQKRLQDTNDIEKLDYFMKLLNKINKKLVKPFSTNQIAFVFLITAKRPDPYQDFKKFLKGSSEQMPKELEYFYSSKSKYHGIRDGILLFPKFFKLNISSFIINQMQDTDKIKTNDTFKDMLDFNNFSIIKGNFSEYKQPHLEQAFSFMSDAKKFLNFNMNNNVLNLKIVSKIGPQSITVLSQNIPNFYRITSEADNQILCDKLCPELFSGQRVLVIYRPLVVKSGQEEILGGLWKINDFVIVKRSYRRFSQDEAILLAQVEHIHASNMSSYISMMIDGHSLLILYSRPGAYAASKILTSGCETGLRVRRTQNLNDVFVEHPMKSGVVFKEKLQMNFHNIFESYTEQNIFKSIRDLYDLEELVLQENVDQHSKNVFIGDEDAQIYLAQKAEVKKTSITDFTRLQVLKDLNEENYNFYVYSTPDEITTDQLSSLFMSDCTQIQQIYMMVKPLLNSSLDSAEFIVRIKQLLERMNFTVVDGREFTLMPNQASDLIEYLSPIKLPEHLVDQYVDIYSHNSVYILSLVKAGGRYEMKNFFKDYNFQMNKQQELPSFINDLRLILIPCLHVEIFRSVSRLFNPFLDQFDGSLFQSDLYEVDSLTHKQLPTKQDKIYLLNYILMSTFGIEVDEERGYDILDHDGSHSLNHSHLQVTSKSHGQFEVRVRIFNKLSRFNLDYFKIVGEYQLLSWYYAKVNLKLKQRCPITYQYRVLHQERAKLGEFDQVFDCQEFCGRIFLIEIYHQIFKFGNDVFKKIKASKQEQSKDGQSPLTYRDIAQSQTQLIDMDMNRVAQIMEARSKIIAYFWGVKLAKFTKELELLDSNDFPNGYGVIAASPDGFRCQYRVKSQENDGLHQVEKTKYAQIMEKIHIYLKDKLEIDPNYDEMLKKLSGTQQQQEMQASMVNQSYFNRVRSEDQRTIVERQVQKYYQIIFGKEEKSETTPLMIYSLEQNNLRLLPSKIGLNNLRILLDKEYIKQNFDGAGGGMQFDYNYELHQTSKMTEESRQSETKVHIKQPLNNFVLVHCLPAVQSKFKLVANIYYMLWVELRIQKQYDNFLNLDMFKNDEEFAQSIVQDNHAKVVPQPQQTNKNSDKSKVFEDIGGMTYLSWFKQRFVLDKEKVIESLIKGFEGNYFLEEEVIQKLQALNKENLDQKKSPIPDVIRMWLYLVCLDELDGYIQTFNEIQLQEIHIQKQLISKDKQMKRWTEKCEQLDKLVMEEKQLEQELVLLTNQRDQVDGFILSIFKFLLSDEFKRNFQFDSERTELEFNQIKQREEKFNMDFYIEYIQNNLVNMDSLKAEEEMETQLNNFFVGKQDRNFSKEFISSKRYFQPLEQGNNQNEWGKLGQEQIDDRMKIIRDDQAEQNIDQLEQFKQAPYMKDRDKDDIQSKWLEGMKNTQNGRFVDTRPDKKKTGIYVDTVNKIDKILDVKIDDVIKKFMTDKMNNFTQKK